jgi:hypothetical protein
MQFDSSALGIASKSNKTDTSTSSSKSNKTEALSDGGIAGIVIALAVLLVVIAILVARKQKQQQDKASELPVRNTNTQDDNCGTQLLQARRHALCRLQCVSADLWMMLLTYATGGGGSGWWCERTRRGIAQLRRHDKFQGGRSPGWVHTRECLAVDRLVIFELSDRAREKEESASVQSNK